MCQYITYRHPSHIARCRIDFKLSPGQIPLAVRSPFTLGPAKGIFVTPMLRAEE